MSQAAYAPPQSIRSVAVLGTGSVCASWTALFLAQGIEVVAYDPGKDAEAKARTFVGNAWPALHALRLASDGTSPAISATKCVTRRSRSSAGMAS
jgi:carnitine 3-dehydrogenase